MKLEFKPNDRGNFYDVLLVDFESGEVIILVAGGRECKRLTDGELRVKAEPIDADDKSAITQILDGFKNKGFYIDWLTFSSILFYGGSYAHNEAEFKKEKRFFSGGVMAPCRSIALKAI